jgi:hypothetical protein
LIDNDERTFFPATSIGGNPALSYNGADVNVRPVIKLQMQSAPTGPQPTSAQVVLTWNGTAQAPVSFNPTGLPAGSVYNMASQGDIVGYFCNRIIPGPFRKSWR